MSDNEKTQIEDFGGSAEPCHKGSLVETLPLGDRLGDLTEMGIPYSEQGDYLPFGMPG